MKRLLREPLFHFVVLGAALFGLNAWLDSDTVEASDRDIIVSEGRVESLIALFVKTRQRSPTAEELKGLIDDHVLEQVLYREAVTLGLDQDDTIVRRRMRQKMEFVVDDILEQAEPTEAELLQWLADHPDSFALPGRLHFRQVYLNAERRGDAVRSDASQLLAQLGEKGAGFDARELGDASLLEHAHADTSTDVIRGTFGKGFAESLAKVKLGEWSGPIESVFGLHVVIVDKHEKGRVPELAEVRAAVARDVAYSRREAEKRQFYDGVLSRYRVEIEWPEELSDQRKDG